MSEHVLARGCFLIKKRALSLKRPRFAVVVVSRGVYSKAVLRNKAKRRVRAAIRMLGVPHMGLVVIVLCPVPDDFVVLADELKKAFRRFSH